MHKNILDEKSMIKNRKRQGEVDVLELELAASFVGEPEFELVELLPAGVEHEIAV